MKRHYRYLLIGVTQLALAALSYSDGHVIFPACASVVGMASLFVWVSQMRSKGKVK